MSYNDEQRRSRVVVETPAARREVVETSARIPERRGFSTGAVAAIALTAVALTAIVLLFIMNNRNDATNTNVRVAAETPVPTVPTPVPTPVIVQPAAPQPPTTIVQPAAPATTTQPAPVIITQPPASSTEGTATTPSSRARANLNSSNSALDDTTIQANVSKRLLDDTELSDAAVTAAVVDGKATLTGMVKTPDLKTRAERVARSVRGVREVDNKIVVQGNTNTETTPPE